MAVVMLTGTSGVGKTTLCNILRDDYGYEVIPSSATTAIRSSGESFPNVPELWEEVIRDPVLMYRMQAIILMRFAENIGILTRKVRENPKGRYVIERSALDPLFYTRAYEMYISPKWSFTKDGYFNEGLYVKPGVPKFHTTFDWDWDPIELHAKAVRQMCNSIYPRSIPHPLLVMLPICPGIDYDMDNDRRPPVPIRLGYDTAMCQYLSRGKTLASGVYELPPHVKPNIVRSIYMGNVLGLDPGPIEGYAKAITETLDWIQLYRL